MGYFSSVTDVAFNVFTSAVTTKPKALSKWAASLGLADVLRKWNAVVRQYIFPY